MPFYMELSCQLATPPLLSRLSPWIRSSGGLFSFLLLAFLQVLGPSFWGLVLIRILMPPMPTAKFLGSWGPLFTVHCPNFHHWFGGFLQGLDLSLLPWSTLISLTVGSQWCTLRPPISRTVSKNHKDVYLFLFSPDPLDLTNVPSLMGTTQSCCFRGLLLGCLVQNHKVIYLGDESEWRKMYSLL